MFLSLTQYLFFQSAVYWLDNKRNPKSVSPLSQKFLSKFDGVVNTGQDDLHIPTYFSQIVKSP